MATTQLWPLLWEWLPSFWLSRSSWPRWSSQASWVSSSSVDLSASHCPYAGVAVVVAAVAVAVAAAAASSGHLSPAA